MGRDLEKYCPSCGRSAVTRIAENPLWKDLYMECSKCGHLWKIVKRFAQNKATGSTNVAPVGNGELE